MRRKLLTLCVTLFLALACSLPAFALEPDLTKTGSVTVTLTEQFQKTPISGAELSLYYIADVGINTDGKLNYILDPTLKDAGIVIDDPALADMLNAFVSGQTTASHKMTTDSQGTASCRDLAPGLYFIRQTGAVEGFAPCAPFLVTIPMETEDGYVFDVNASPKTEVAKLTDITIKKVWNTDASTQAADQVTVQLLRKSNVVQIATLNAENNWQVTYTDMPESDAYTIVELDVPKGFTATYNQKGYVFTVTNTSTLIQTGQLVWPIPLLAISGMLLLAAGVALLQKKRDLNA